MGTKYIFLLNWFRIISHKRDYIKACAVMISLKEKARSEKEKYYKEKSLPRKYVKIIL